MIQQNLMMQQLSELDRACQAILIDLQNADLKSTSLKMEVVSTTIMKTSREIQARD